MPANNVVQGPWGTLPPSPDDKEVGENVQNNFLFLMSNLMERMELVGIDNLNDDNYIYDLALIAETLRSYLYKTQGKYHPCQDVASNLFHWNHGGLQINPSIDVEFK
jgi:hypothetical protein